MAPLAAYIAHRACGVKRSLRRLKLRPARNPAMTLPLLLFALVFTAQDPAPRVDRTPFSQRSLKDCLKELESDQPAVRQRAAFRVFLLDPGGSESLPTLVKAMRDPDPEVATEIIITVGRIGAGGSDFALRHLVNAAADRRAAVRIAAITALRDLGEAAVPALMVALAHEDPATRRRAAGSLWYLGPTARATLPALIAAVKDGDPKTASAVVDALGTVGSVDADTAVPAILEALKDPSLRDRAIRGLAHIGEPARAATPSLQRLLEQYGWETPEGEQVARCLAKIGAPPVEMLTRAVVRESDFSAASLLGEFGPIARSAVPALSAALDDDRPSVRTLSAIALATIDATVSRVVPTLVQGMNATGPDSMAFQAVEALGQMGAAAALSLDALLGAIRTQDNGLHLEAARALGMIRVTTPPVVSALATALEDDDEEVRAAAADALGSLGAGAKSAVPALVKLLKGPPPDEFGGFPRDPRVSAARALGLVGKDSSAAIVALINALRDSDYDVVRTAINALAAIGPEAAPSAFPHLVQVAAVGPFRLHEPEAAIALVAYGAQGRTVALRMAQETPDFRRRAAILSALGLPSSEAKAMTVMGLESLQICLLNDFAPGDVVSSLDFVSQFGPNAQAAVPVITKLLHHREETVRRAAETALRRITALPRVKDLDR